jgi:excisionase family DNA binding protein
MDDNGTGKLLTLQEVKSRLNIHENTLYRYISKGMIPVVVISRSKRYVRQEDLDKFLSGHRVVADTPEGKQWQKQ